MSLCECEYGDETRPTLWRDTFQTARKDHRCDDCGGVITAGQRYMRIEYKWEGEFGTTKVCQGCRELHKVFTCVAYGDLKRAVFDELNEGTGDLPVVDIGLAGAAKLDELLAEYTERYGDIEEAA